MKLVVLFVVFVLLLEHATTSMQTLKLSPKKTVWQSDARRKRSLGDGTWMNNRNNDHVLVSPDGSNYSPSFSSDRIRRFASRQKLSDEERRKLEAMYGADVVRQHYGDFERARELGQYGAQEHRIPWSMMPDNQRVDDLDKEYRNDAKLSAVNFEPIPPKIIVVDEAESRTTFNKKQPLIADSLYHCNIHGLWMSSVAGVAIEILPIVEKNGRIEIRTKIFDLPDTSRKGILTNQWTGSGMISPESPTTMTIVFQEHISEITNNNAPVANNLGESEPAKLPRTAVFVGQCLVCENSPVLQGTWTVFPNTQSCTSGTKTLDEVSAQEEVDAKRTETLHLFSRSLADLN